MTSNQVITIVVLAFVLAVAASFFCFNYFSEEARTDRRRRKSHSRLVKKTKQPSVSLFVKTKKKD